MGKWWKNSPWCFGLAIVLTIGEPLTVGNNRTLAQITPDTTLGIERSVVTPNVNIRGLPGDSIDGGATRGTNLFHSFSEFNVGEGLRVYFSNPAGIENILTRVTGNNLSNILGTLGVDGGANLFLLNPNGIIFGPNAKLDIAGSFVASTASGVVFDNGFTFSTTNPQAPPLLTISVPLGLQYGSNPSNATIANFGNLTVGRNLGLAADNLNLQGQLQAGGHLALFALNTLQVRDSATKPFIAKAGGQMVVQGNQTVDIFALNHSESGFFSGGDMVLRSVNTVVGDARYWSGGSFRIEGLDGTLKDLSSPNDPIIRSVGNVSFNNYIGTSLHILAGGRVRIPGIVAIIAPETGTAGFDYLAEEVPLSDGTVVPINGRDRPTFDVRAGVERDAIGIPRLTGTNGDLFYSGFINWFGLIIPNRENPVRTNVPTSADINIGGITMLGRNAANGQVFLTNQYRPNRLLPGGNIEVGAIVTTDNIAQFANQLPANLRTILNSVGLLDGFTGNGGSVILDSRSQITMNGTSLSNFGLNVGLINTSSGTGNAGDITLLARDRISLANTLLLSDTSGTGRGGDITIKAPSVSFTDRTVVSSSTFGTGQGGKLTVIAPNSVDVARSNLFASTTGDGHAGDLNILTGRLTVRDEAAVATVSLGDGDAGDLRIDTKQLIVQDGIITTSTLSGPNFDLPLGEGDGGELIVNASDSVELTSISANSTILLNIPIPGFRFAQIETPVGLFTTSQSVGNAGNLTLTTGKLTVQGGAVASTSTFNRGQGGNLTIKASQQVELIGTSSNATVPSALLSETYGSGKGGNLTLSTPYLLIKDGALISAGTGDLSKLTATNTTGDGGNLTITSNLIELSGTSSNPLFRSAILTATAGAGNAGDLWIDTDKLIVRNGAVILAATLGEGNSGKLTVNAKDSIEAVGTAPDNLPSGLSTGTAGKGDGNDLTINTRRLTVRDGALITAGTAAAGKGGNLNVNVSDLVELIGTDPDGRPSGLSAGSGIEGVSAIPLLRRFGVDPSKATGDSGNLHITTGRLVVRDKAEVSTATIGPGVGGNIQIRANSLALSNGAQVSAATSGQGSAGSITVRDADSISLSNSSISSAVNSGATVSDALSDRSGNINLQARQLFLTNGSEVAASTSGQGNAGSISVRDAQEVSLTNSSISSAVNAGAVGQGGTVDIQARSLSLNNNARVSAATSGKGSAGSITVRDADSISLSNSSISSAVNSGATVSDALSDRSGNINLQARQLFLTNGSEVAASTSGQGNAGSIAVRNADLVSLSNSSITSAVNAGAVGQGGTVDIQARSLSLNNNARVSAATSGKGSAGSITVRDADSISLSNSSISSAVNSGATVSDAVSDRSGNINLQARQLFLTNGSEVAASTSGQGNAGSISVRDADLVSLSNSSITSAVNAGAVGQGGKIDIQARSLSLNNGARLSAATSGQGNAGSIAVRDAQDVSLSNSSISSAVNVGGVGQGGKIDIQARSLSLNNNAQVSAATSGTGKAGNISVYDADTVSLNNSSISTAVNPDAVGQGGDVDIHTRSLSLNNAAQISASTSGQGRAGSLNVRAKTIEAANGGQFLTSTASSENAGNITLTVKDDVKLIGSGSGIFANTTTGSTGKGGSIALNVRTLEVRDGAGIAVGSQGTGAGGDVEIQSNSLTLNNRGFISAKTASNTGGNITLGVQDLLLLRHGSEISTTAGTAQAGGDGGNITISAGFILGIPQENSDITANAFKGRGGSINITTQGIFGLEFRPRLTPLSDITASSEFGINGTVQINTLGIDPNRGLAELPTDLVDAAGLIDRRCQPGEDSTQNSSFTITGRGGLPPNPNETLGEEGLLEDLGTPTNVSDRRRGGQSVSTSVSFPVPSGRLVEAQGWIIAPDGRVILTAQAPSATPQYPWQTPASCNTLSNASPR